MRNQVGRAVAILVLALAVGVAAAASNGKLQIHYMNVGQGDGAILISPAGQTVMFDNGTSTKCTNTLKYLASQGIKEIDYHVVSHYHLDHFGCSKRLFAQIRLKTAAYDRGVEFKSDSVDSLTPPKAKAAYNKYVKTAYYRYVTSIGDKRTAAAVGDEIILDAASTNPVKIRFVAVNGNEVETINENDLSLVALVEFGRFRTSFAGDLSGYDQAQYQDIETSTAPLVKRIDVYKVHHHCSRYSTNEAWLSQAKPTISIVSVGLGNGHKHPTPECLKRLLNAGVKKNYWTERGGGAKPRPNVDVVAGHIVVEVEPGAGSFSVRYKKSVDQYPIAAAP